MECKHELLRTVGDEVFCQKCGAHLTLEFLASKGGETPPEPQEEKKTRKPSRKAKTP